MFTPAAFRPSRPPEVAPGVVKNSFGGYQIHVILNRRETPLLTGAVEPQTLAAPGTPTLAHLWVFEDCVLLVLQGGQALVLHVSDPAAAGRVLYFHHANGTLWRAVPLERVNPGWVLSAYRFDGALTDLYERLARLHSWRAAPPTRRAPIFWHTGGWQGAVVFTGVALVGRIRAWQFSPLPQPQVSTATPAQVEVLSQASPADVQQLLALRASGVTKVTYQIGGLNLALSYLERIGWAAAVDRHCPRAGQLSEGTVLTVLVLNRLLAPCALHNVAAWVARSGLHLLLGIPAPTLLNSDRLVDALLAGAPHWQAIAAAVTLQAVAAFGLHFKVKEPLTDQARQAMAQRRRQQHQRGRRPSYREVHFWVRAAVILDTARQTADAAQRQRRLQAYTDQLAWVSDHLNKGRFYSDPVWVADHLANLAQEFQDVAPLLQVVFTTRPDARLALTYQQRPDQIAKAAQFDGKWVLVSNQPLLPGQSTVAYLDWLWRVYKNHSHVERRMRNLKSDVPIRPVYLHRDEAIVALGFVGVVALMLYTLIERDCQADPALVAAGLTTTEQVLAALAGFCLTVLRTPSGWNVFWLDTPTATHQLIWQQLRLPDPGIRLPVARPARPGGGLRAAGSTGWCPALRETDPHTADRGVDGLCLRPELALNAVKGCRNQPTVIAAAAARECPMRLVKCLSLCYAGNGLQTG